MPNFVPQIMGAPPAGGPGWLFYYAYSLLAELSYYNDLTFDNTWATEMGFTTAQTVVTPAPQMPNYTRILSNDGAVISIAGTVNFSQMFENAYYSGYADGGQFGPGKVHSYFQWCARSLLPFIQADLATVPAGKPVCFTGHSLGGAVAQLLAAWFERNTNRPVNNCVVFCTPKVGNDTWTDWPHLFRYRHIFNDRDIVPTLPPGVDIFLPVLNSIWNHETRIGYKFKTPAFYLVPGRWESLGVFGLVLATGETVLAAQAASNYLLSTGSVFSATPFYNDHKLRTTINILRSYAERQANWSSISPLGALDDDMAGTPLTATAAPPGPFGEGLVNPGNFMDPQNLPPASPAPLPVPLTPHLDAIANFGSVTVQGSGATHTAFGLSNPPPLMMPGDDTPSFEGVGKRNYVFRGEDRRLIQTLAELMDAIEGRDELVLTGKPTASISTRELLLPLEDDTLREAWGNVKAQMMTALTWERAS